MEKQENRIMNVRKEFLETADTAEVKVTFLLTFIFGESRIWNTPVLWFFWFIALCGEGVIGALLLIRHLIWPLSED